MEEEKKMTLEKPQQPNGTPNMQGQPYPNGMPNGMPNGAPNMQGHPYPNGMPNGAPNMQGQPYPNGMPNGMPNGAPNMQGQPYPNGMPNGAPNMQGQPYPNGPQGGYYQQQMAPQAPNQAVVFAKNIWTTFLTILKAPVTAGSAFLKKEGTTAAVGLCVVQALLSALFAILLVGNNNLSYFDESLALPKVFFVTLLLSVVFSMIYAGVLVGCSAIFHLGLDFKKALQAVGARSVGVMPFIVLAMVVALLNPGVGIAVFIASAFSGMMYLIASLMEQQNREKIMYSAVISTVIMFWIFLASVLKYADSTLGGFLF